eukprot:5998299-Amphidinium_carterae.1
MSWSTGLGFPEVGLAFRGFVCHLESFQGDMSFSPELEPNIVAGCWPQHPGQLCQTPMTGNTTKARVRFFEILRPAVS